MQGLALALISLLLAQIAATAFSGTVTLDGSGQTRTDQVGDSTGWLHDSSFGFNIRIDTWTLTCSEPYLSPSIYVFIDAKNFTEENLKKVFTGFSELYSHARFLSVTAISDIGILAKVMKDRGAFLGSEPDAFMPGTGQFAGFFFRDWEGEEEFHYTPHANRPDFITVALKTKENHLAPQSELKRAASTGDTARLKELFDEGAGVKFKTILLFTQLIYAAREGTGETVEKLIAEGAEINARNRYGRTALLEAAYAGNTEVIEALIRNHADLNARDKHRNCAVMLAVHGNHLDAVRLLLGNGTNTRAKDDVGLTALEIAKRKNRNEAMVRLLEEAERKR